ncbi:hypothetical protein CDD83_9438 [Cordyceps sp. RAO-2017]|nr:hypothetical protein CDD83_9438 [Cordyceps sp. RAO-2017]
MNSQDNNMKCGNGGCSKPAAPADSASLRRCSRCRRAAYCSRECQTAAWPAHKGGCVRPNYIVKFHLAPAEITGPAVTRTLSCPANAVFYMLHMALQTAFGWATTHSFDFAVLDPDYREPDNIMDVMSRQMAARHPSGMGLSASAPREYMFRVVDPVEQTVFSGIDRMHEGIRCHPRTAEKKADSYKLWQLFDDEQYQDHQILYTYDFGDNWEHHLTVMGRANPTTSFVCLDGSGHGVAEDCAGVNGWQELKAAYRAKKPSEKQLERRRWLETQASNADPRGLAGDRVHAWDRDKVNRDLDSEKMFDRFERMGDAAAAFQDRAATTYRLGK